MTQRNLPEDFVNLGPVSIHVDDLRSYTQDTDRFLEYLPLARRLSACGVDSLEAQDIWCTAGNRQLLLVTLGELAALILALAQSVQALQAEPAVVH